MLISNISVASSIYRTFAITQKERSTLFWVSVTRPRRDEAGRWGTKESLAAFATNKRMVFIEKHHKLGEGLDSKFDISEKHKEKNEVVSKKIWTGSPKTKLFFHHKSILNILFWSFSDRWLPSFTLTPSHWLKWGCFIPKLLLVLLVSLRLLEFTGTWGLSDTWICRAAVHGGCVTFIAVTQRTEECMGGIHSHSLVALTVRAIINQRNAVSARTSGSAAAQRAKTPSEHHQSPLMGGNC